MRKLVIAAFLAATIATPALARDGSAYIGIDAGIVKPQGLDLRFSNSAVTVPDGVRLTHKTGYDIDGVVGYDFGMFRLEGELAYKHSRTKSATLDPAALAAVLLAPTPSGLPADGHGNVLSGMVRGPATSPASPLQMR